MLYSDRRALLARAGFSGAQTMLGLLERMLGGSRLNVDETQPGTPSGHSVSRRGFLAAGGVGVVGLTMAERAAVLQAQQRSGRRSVILVVMNGGPSQLETFDPKPNAPSEIRGPLRAISTAVPGIAFSEAFPRLGLRAGSTGGAPQSLSSGRPDSRNRAAAPPDRSTRASGRTPAEPGGCCHPHARSP